MNSGVDFKVPAVLPAGDGSADGGSADGSGIGSGWRRLRWLLDGVWVTLPAWVADTCSWA